MNFIGTGQLLSGNDYARAADALGCDEPATRAVTFVEARGNGFDKMRRPIMLPERHVFYRNLSGAKRDSAVTAGLAYRDWRPGNYPAAQDERYRLLEEMMAIDEAAALKACSWGIGQVLGENHGMCGFSSPRALVEKCLEGEGGQLDVMVGFIKGAGLAIHLRRKDWAAFARGYNGKGYAANRYDQKLARAYERFRSYSPASYDPLADGLLSIGDKGEIVASLQRSLGIHADGDFGPLTEQAVRKFQRMHDLVEDGKVGRSTGAALGLTFWSGVPLPTPEPAGELRLPAAPPVLDAVPAPAKANDQEKRASAIADVFLSFCSALSTLLKGSRS